MIKMEIKEMEVRMKRGNKIFLLSGAVPIEPQGPELCYDQDLNLNVLQSDRLTPYANIKNAAPTHSKTAQYPGDDDPDPGQMQCY
jgi:hypothetical protein